MTIEFGTEIVSGKVKFRDSITSLQIPHENTAVIGQAWDFLQHEFNSKSIYVAPNFQWSLIDKTFTEQAKPLVQDILFTKHSMRFPASTDYKVIKAKARKVIQEAIKTYLDENPTKRQAPMQQTLIQGQVANGNGLVQNADP
jgi:recombinational DNA repair protein (RecF pathway)